MKERKELVAAMKIFVLVATVLGAVGCGDGGASSPCETYCHNMASSGCTDVFGREFDEGKCVERCAKLEIDREERPCEGAYDNFLSCVIDVKFSCDWRYHEIFTITVPLPESFSITPPECQSEYDAYRQCKANERNK